MNQNQAGYIIVPLVTPSDSEDFLPLIDHIIEGGIQDLVLFGTTGEGEKLDLKTKKHIIQSIVSFVEGRARLYIGLLCSTIADAINLTSFCHDTV